MALNNVTVNVHLHIDSVSGKLDRVLINQETMAKKIDEILALQQEQKVIIDNISADLDRIAGDIEGGLTPEEAETVAADMRATNAKLKALADKNPETETPPTE